MKNGQIISDEYFRFMEILDIMSYDYKRYVLRVIFNKPLPYTLYLCTFKTLINF